MRRIGILLATLAIAGCQCEGGFGRLDAAVELVPESLDFEKVPVATRAERTFTLRNRGSFTLTASAWEVAPPFFPPEQDVTLAPGATAEVTVAFAPTEVGPASDTLLFATNDPEAPTLEVPLTGTGIEAAVGLEPSVAEFGEVLWDRDTARKFISVTVSNPGSDAFDVTAVELVEDAGGAFELDPGDAADSYAPGATGAFEVSFLPVALGPASGKVVLTTTARTAPQVELPLRAQVVGPDMVVCVLPPGGTETCTPATLTLPLGSVELDQTVSGEIRVRNDGSRDLHISTLRLNSSSDDFVLEPELASGGEAVAPSETRVAFVRYTPSNFGQDTGVVAVLGDSATRPIASIGLSARAARPDIRAVPEGVTKSFQSSVADATVDISLFSCGDDPLVLGDIVLERDPAPVENAITLLTAPASGTTLEGAGNDCESVQTPEIIRVGFYTEVNGIYRGRILVPTNDPVDPELPIELVFQKSG